VIGFAMLTAMLVTACATTELTSVWKDRSYQGQPRKILVIGIARKALNKRLVEDEFVRQLKVRGTDAVASYTVMPDDEQGDREVIAAKMKEQGADAVLISRLASRKTVYTYVPITGPSFHYDNWRDYYAYGFQSVSTPGYMDEDEYALMETNLYDAGSDKLIWGAASETEMHGSDQSQIKSYIGVMVKAMADQKVVH
jgi:hypothetical protein